MKLHLQSSIITYAPELREKQTGVGLLFTFVATTEVAYLVRYDVICQSHYPKVSGEVSHRSTELPFPFGRG